ncbi:MAG: glycosyltransferase family 4 protein [bacterium]
MKIFHVITSLKIGGAESALLNFLKKDLCNKNDHIIAYFYPGPNLEKLQKLGFKTYHIKGLFHKYDFLAYKNLKHIIKINKPDIIHSALWSANIFAKIIASSLNIPVICDLHSNVLYDGKIRRLIEKFTLFKADKYVAVSDSVKNGFLRAYKQKSKILKSKIEVIPNAIDINNKQKSNLTRKDLGFYQEDFVIGAVGRLEKIKSYDLLIKSVATICNTIEKINNSDCNNKQLKSIKLCIVGDGSQRNKLEKLGLKLKIEKYILFTGMRDDVKDIYPLFDCFIISSQSEGLSIALLEALSFKLPIITTSQTEKHDIIINNINGLIVKPQDQKELATAIKKLYQNPELANKIGKNNEILTNTKFSINQLVNKYNRLYKELRYNKRKSST